MIALITPPTVSPALARNYNSLFASGLDALIIRMPGADRNDYEAVVAAIEPKWRHLLLVDNYYDLTQTASVGGIQKHLCNSFGKRIGCYSSPAYDS